MHTQQFQHIAAYLLKTHYGLMLSDTALCEDYPQGISDGEYVFSIINHLAEKFDLVRIDKLSNAPLTDADEKNAFHALNY